MLNSIVSFVVAFGILTFVHEFGHYALARLCGVQVVRFSVGFGKPIFSWVSKKSGEIWTVSWIPLGGFVSMLDERDPKTVGPGQPDLTRAFNRKPVWQKIAIVLAGPVANLLLASVLYAGVDFFQNTRLGAVAGAPAQGSVAQEMGLVRGDRVVAINGETVSQWRDVEWDLIGVRLFRDDLQVVVQRGGQTIELKPLPSSRLDVELGPQLPAQLGFVPNENKVFVRSVLDQSPADKAGFLVGDRLLSVNGLPVDSARQFTHAMKSNPHKPVNIAIERKDVRQELHVTPEQVVAQNGEVQGRVGMGVSGDLALFEYQPGLFEALFNGFDKMIEVSVFSLVALGKMLTLDLSWQHLSGPVSIASAAGASSSLGILPFVGFLAMVSVSLGVLNLLPIPVLDGGHLMYYLAELCTGKPVDPAWMVWGQKLGLLLIGLLSCVAFFNDMQRLF